MADSVETPAIYSCASSFSRFVMCCLDVCECLFGNLTNNLGTCEALKKKRVDCPVFALMKEIRETSPLFYEQWKRIVESQVSPAHKHGINALISYGIALLYATFIQTPLWIDSSLIQEAKKLEVNQLILELQPYFIGDLIKSLEFLKPEDQTAVLQLFWSLAESYKRIEIIV